MGLLNVMYTLLLSHFFGTKFLYTREFPQLCNETVKHQILKTPVRFDVKHSMCIKDRSQNFQSLTINNKTMKINETSIHSDIRVYSEGNTTDRYFVMIVIKNISNQTPLKYEVKLKTITGRELTYTFDIVLPPGFLHLCAKEDNVTTYTTYSTGSIIMHVCYQSQIEILDNVLINNVSYPVNEYVTGADIAVTNEQIKGEFSKSIYYLQIYCRNISLTIVKDYSLEIRTKENQVLRHSLHLFNSQNMYITQVFGCDGKRSKMYYYTKMQRNLTICRTLENRVINKASFVIFGMKTPEPLHNVNVHYNTSKLFIEVVNVTDYNVGRYGVTLELEGNDTEVFTFYLIIEEDLPNYECGNGTNNTIIKSNSDGYVSFCFETFGFNEQSLYINDQSFPISATASAVKGTNIRTDNFYNVTVSSRSLNRRYIQVELFVTKSVNLTLGLDSTEKNLTFYIISTKTECVFPESKSFTADQGDEINIILCDSINYVKSLSIFINERQIYEKSNQHRSYSIVHINGEMESKKLLLTFTNMTDEDFRNSTIYITLDNWYNISTTISLRKKSLTIGTVMSQELPNITYTVPIVAIALFSASFLIMVFIKKLGRGRSCKTVKRKIRVMNDYFQEDNNLNGGYVNFENCHENEYINIKLQPSNVSMTGHLNFTNDPVSHVYTNTRALKQDTYFNMPGPSLTGRYFNNEGLMYVTISHGNQVSSTTPYNLSTSCESVMYTSIDTDKTKLMALMQRKNDT